MARPSATPLGQSVSTSTSVRLRCPTPRSPFPGPRRRIAVYAPVRVLRARVLAAGGQEVPLGAGGGDPLLPFSVLRSQGSLQEDLFPFDQVDSIMRSQELLMRRQISCQMQEMDTLSQDMERLRNDMQTQTRQLEEYPRGFHWEETRQSEPGANQRFYSHQSITVYGSSPSFYQVQPTTSPTLLGFYVPLLLATIYIAGAFRLFGGFLSTRYKLQERMRLVILWPFFYLFSRSFRDEFRKAFQRVPPPSGGNKEQPPSASS